MKRRVVLFSLLTIAALAIQPAWTSLAAPLAQDEMVFDFLAAAPHAQWKSGAGSLPFPGTSGDWRGYAYVVESPVYEDGSPGAPALLTVPQNKYDGYIMGVYPEFTVQRGDRFKATVGCEPGAKNCYVTYRLDYLTPGGNTIVFWKWKEKNEGRVYNVDLDLSSLAGKRVRFVLTMLASGPADGDRPLWGAPRITRPGNGETPLPTLTPTPTPFPSPPPVTPAPCNRAAFVADVTVPDGAVFSPNAAFTKTWEVKNTGACTWTKDYALVFYGGQQMNGPTEVKLSNPVAPGQTVRLTVNLVAPPWAGMYRGEWILRTPKGELFGVGPLGTTPLWVTINTAGVSPATDTGYDFVANACAAQWKSGAGNLPCPGSDGNKNGFLLIQNAPVMENGQTGAPGLLTAPQNKTDGYIMGIYPTFTVQPGDRFKATIGCENGARSCYVTYRLDYLTSGGATVVFWKRNEKFEGQTANVDVDLTPLAGKSVRFSLTILAAGPAAGDRAHWIAPRIVRKGGSDLPPTPSGWLTYTNSAIGFRFNYPVGSTLTETPPNLVRIDLPFAPGTNLRHKYLEAIATEYTGICLSHLASGPTGSSSRRIVINGMDFVEQWGEDAGAGNRYQWFAYSTVRGADCLTFNFVLHSLNPGNFPTPPPVFNLDAESAVFRQIVSTLVWIPTPSTLYGPYAVMLVRPGDVLNIRAAAGADQPLVGAFDAGARNIYATGRTQQAGSADWWEVKRPDGDLGWVNAFYLAEYVAPDFFVGDNRVINLIDNKLRPAMLNADGDLFASIVSPRHGVTIAYHNYGGQTRTYFPSQARAVFTSSESVNWGSGARGEPDIGTFNEIIRPAFVDVFSATYQLHPNNPMGANMYVEPWPLSYQNLNFHSLWKPATPGVDFDWREWLIGYEYVDGKPYIVLMIHFVWEP